MGVPPVNTTGKMPAVPIGRAIRVLGAICLVLCVGAALALVLEHLVGLQLPGCGAGSPCAKASASVWGKVPYINWPVSFLGLAYFLGLLVAWLAARGSVSGAARWVIRLGLLLSLGFTVVMFAGGYVCPYCLATHAGNLVFWLCMEFGTRAAPVGRRPLTALVAVFVLCSAVLGGAEWRGRARARTTAEREMQASEAAILSASTQPDAGSSDKNESVNTAPREAVAEAGVRERILAPAAVAEAGVRERILAPAAGVRERILAPAVLAPAAGFTGRWRLGPEAAPIRVVLFMDYQCKGCHLIELELKKIMEQHPDISLSVKHWPGGSECNPNPAEREHIYACADARAAEAAGILHGNDGFWKLHFWLFGKSGRATDADFRAACAEFGWDADEFDRVRHSDETQRRIEADVVEGFSLGLSSTPMVFINAVEFKGWAAPLGLTRVVDAISQKDLPAKTAASDRAMPAKESFIFQWRQAKARDLPATAQAWPRGPAAAKLKIVVWGDYQQPNTALADRIIREFSAARSDVQYTFHPYPLNRGCNVSAKEDEYPSACRAAHAAQAAGLLAGADGYWRMHDWLLKHQADFSDDTLRSAAVELGLDPTELFSRMDNPAVSAAIAEVALAGSQAGLQHSPLMFLNGKIVPRWLHGKEPVLRAILDAAAE
jgi:protein-disulfide isomerase/uncharacterized membrane protein